MEYMDSEINSGINSEQFLLGFGTIKMNNSQRMEIAAQIAETMLIAEHAAEADRQNKAKSLIISGEEKHAADEYWTTPIYVTHENGDQTYTEYAQDNFNNHYQFTLDTMDEILGLGE